MMDFIDRHWMLPGAAGLAVFILGGSWLLAGAFTAP